MDWLSQNLLWIVIVVVLFAMFRLSGPRPSRREHDHRAMRDESSALNDPVTGNRVDPAHAIKAEYNGRTFFFESESSRTVFLQNPSRFVQQHHRHHGCC
ncbi:TPA: YHS domain-containing protein [Burkholderia contaminans]|uniref:YHS domain-containing protein n=1 Tax=Burkholderia cepacia complex TaxID=87882 RepID=UPI0009BE5535|nr:MULTISPECIES: YHS domain-containing protein [Burkholderia cepacia complex]MBM6430555.1 YHS domain-containing protein [Burkholderia contaminans]MCA7880862.1 YHS domain-containing protein [Burkholderia contaminans]MDN8025814.1 YHS domain-containing protein [Burkholderia contaminans]PRG04210.1 YHS domain-containing protein [Burkholderia contaminans]